MNYRIVRALVVAVLVVAAAALVGSYGYHLGVAHGIAESGRLVAPNEVPMVPYWPRPWGFGFGYFPVFPLFLLILFWIVIARALFWRGRWARGCHRGWPGRGVPPAFEEWHRRMHEQQPPWHTNL